MAVIVPDVNILVYAFREESESHEVYAAWLNRALAESTIGLADTVLSGFLRIVTHPKIMATPAPIAAALEFTRAITASPRSVWLTQGSPVWEAFDQLADDDPAIRAHLVPDAYIAALCLTNRARLATRDRGFGRYRGLDSFDPARD